MDKRIFLLLLVFANVVVATELEINPVMVKSLITINDEIRVPIKVRNIGDVGENISSGSSKEYFKLNDNSFFLRPNQTRGLYFNFKPEVLGVYSGEIKILTEGKKYVVPIVVEVESKDVLFDSKVEVKNNLVEKGDKLQVGVDFFNLREISDDDIDVSYYIREIDGDAILEENEEISVKSHEYFLKEIELPDDIRKGNYIVMVKTRKGVSIGISTDTFQVVIPEKEVIVPNVFDICMENKVCLISVTIGTIILGLLVVIYLVDIFIISRMSKKKLKKVYKKPGRKRDSLVKRIEKEFGLVKTKRQKEKEREDDIKGKVKKMLKDKRKSF